MDNLGLPLILIGLLGLLDFALYMSHQSANRFEARIQNEYQTCIAAKETEYTCRAYIESMRDDTSTISAVFPYFSGVRYWR